MLQAVSDWLTSEDHGRWLIVLGNADDATIFFTPQKFFSKGTLEVQDAPPLCTYLPQSSWGSILVTSRDRRAAFRLTGRTEHVINILPLEEKDAKALLRKRLPNDKSSENDTIALIETLERLPLAITQAAAYIGLRGTIMTMIKYVAYVRQNEEILLADMGDLRRHPSVPNSVLVTWQMSFDQIKESHPQAARLLSLASMLDRQGIPGFLLQQHESWLEFEDALAVLHDFALITYEDNTKCFGLHQLVQAATRKWLHIHDKIRKWEEEAMKLLSKSFPNAKYENWKTCAVLMPHAEVVLGYQYLKQHCSLRQARLWYNTAWYLLAQGKYDMALDRSQKVLRSIRHRHYKEGDIAVLGSMNLTGLALSRQGKYAEGEAMFRQALTLSRRLVGIEHPTTLVIMNNLAAVFNEVGKPEEVMSMYRQILALSQRVLGMEHLNTLMRMDNLAIALHGLGRNEEAMGLHRPTLHLTSEVLETEHHDTLGSMDNLASALDDLGEHKEAEAMLQRILVLEETVLRPDHPTTLRSAWLLASTLHHQRRYQDALNLVQRVSIGFQERLGHNSSRYLGMLEAL